MNFGEFEFELTDFVIGKNDDDDDDSTACALVILPVRKAESYTVIVKAADRGHCVASNMCGADPWPAFHVCVYDGGGEHRLDSDGRSMADEMSLDARSLFHPIPLFHLNPIIQVETTILNSEHYSYVSDVCDWQGSKSLSSDSDRLVVPIYLRCSRGMIKWFYPTGGLRVVLKLGTNGKDFRGCIRVARNTSRNVRIYIEGKRQLFQIFSADDGKHNDLFRCFVSVNHFMALFIETDSSSLYPHDPVIFQYDLQQINSTSLLTFDDEIACKPCSDEQTLSLFCSADFALIGKISYYRDRPELELTEFMIKPSYVYRLPVNTSFIYDGDLLPSINHSQDFQDERTNSIELISLIVLNRRLECKSNMNSNKHLFLGKLILGKYFITCSTKLEYWKQISQRAILNGTNQCHMS